MIKILDPVKVNKDNVVDVISKEALPTKGIINIKYRILSEGTEYMWDDVAEKYTPTNAELYYWDGTPSSSMRLLSATDNRDVYFKATRNAHPVSYGFMKEYVDARILTALEQPY